MLRKSKSCRHIRPSGRRCQSPALRDRAFCYHHESINAHLRTLHPPDDGTHNFIHPMVIDPERFQREPMLAEYFAEARGPLELHFPTLEDSDAVQLALSMVLTALGQNRLELKRATTMLYTLQIASTNATRLTHESKEAVEDFTTDPTGQILAPENETPAETPYEQPTERTSETAARFHGSVIPSAAEGSQHFTTAHNTTTAGAPHLES